ncbi:MAG: hypothetical protein CMJ24_03185 [Phycisphaerae bacterium]|nr:hypothetical protein [Phycisphaerae bacterium]
MWTVAAASTLLSVGSAQAELLGLSAKLVDANHITGANAPTGDHFTIDIFATMEAGDRLDAMAGDVLNQKMITCTNGTFYQHPFGGNLSTNINSSLFGSFASLAFDSFVTIGLLDSTDNQLAVQGIDFSDFQTGGAIDSDNGAWFITPEDPQGASEAQSIGCDTQYVVRVARLTVVGLDGSVHVEGLLQGKDPGGNTITLNASIDVTLASVQFDDCNANGNDDACDIADGTSIDSDENGIPDECQTFDCNENGIDDGDEIADGTADDCNSNGTLDECEIADGTASDCDGNGTPDECQANDCNGNGTPDNCDITDGTSEDCDNDGTPDECEPDSDGDGIIDDCEVPPNYTNLETGDTYETFADAIGAAHAGDRITGLTDAVNNETALNFNETCVNFSVPGFGGINTNAEVFLSYCATIDSDGSALFQNKVFSGSGGTSRITADGNLEFFDTLTVRSGATIETECFNGTDTNGVILRQGAMLTASRFMTLNAATTMFEGAMIECPHTQNEPATLFNAQGTILGDVQNFGLMNVINDLMQIGDLSNETGATIDIFRGVYYLVGDFTNNGTIHGEIDQGGRSGEEAQPGDGLNIHGSFTAGAETSLVMPHEYWAVRIGGDIDIAINDAGSFDMSVAELNATGRSGSVQDIEVMGADLGNGTDGLKQGVAGNYPLGSLIIDAASTSNLVDNHDNDNMKQADGEAIYCDTLIVNGHLETNGYKVYANEIVINGSVSNGDDVIIIVDGIFGDISGDGLVNVIDLLRVIAEWGQTVSTADLNEDGIVDVLDFLIVLQVWS